MRYAVPVSGGVLTAGDNICDHQVENRLLSEDSGPLPSYGMALDSLIAQAMGLGL